MNMDLKFQEPLRRSIATPVVFFIQTSTFPGCYANRYVLQSGILPSIRGIGNFCSNKNLSVPSVLQRLLIYSCLNTGYTKFRLFSRGVFQFRQTSTSLHETL